MKKILEKIFPNIVKMKIEEVLKKCFENKILVHFEYEKSYFEKFGIIERFDNKKIILKEIDKMTGIFVAKSEIIIEDISFLFVRNCKVLGIWNFKKRLCSLLNGVFFDFCCILYDFKNFINIVNKYQKWYNLKNKFK